MSKILRGGRIASTRSDVAKFTSSIKDDAKLAKAVIDINKAHVIMLTEQKIVNQSDGAKLLQALSGKLNLKMDPSSEDVHMAVEEAVQQEAGPEVGGNLHIAKSRNDQVATAIRMELRKSLLDLMLSLINTQESLAATAEKHVETVVLAYTHLQPAQPVTFAHYLLARFDQLKRDLQRLQGAYERVNLCPMGAGALATTSFPINRERVAELLGFNGLVENSIDAVGSRDFILETTAALTLLAVNLSQFAEDLVVWSSPDFGVIEIPGDFTSTSSMMPQKKNPEVPEIIRARASHVLGDFVAAAAAMKSMPSTYNLDFQEVTPKLWTSIESTSDSLRMLAELVPNLKVSSNVSEKALTSFVAATELANILVRKYNVAFRSAHKTVGAFVRAMLETNRTFRDATPELLQKAAKDSAGIELTVDKEDLAALTNLKKIVASHKVKGGPAPAEVKRALIARKKSVILSKSNISKMKQALDKAEKRLEAMVKSMSYTSSDENVKLKNKKF
jgi:argininosuccinate lyase